GLTTQAPANHSSHRVSSVHSYPSLRFFAVIFSTWRPSRTRRSFASSAFTTVGTVPPQSSVILTTSFWPSSTVTSYSTSSPSTVRTVTKWVLLPSTSLVAVATTIPYVTV